MVSRLVTLAAILLIDLSFLSYPTAASSVHHLVPRYRHHELKNRVNVKADVEDSRPLVKRQRRKRACNRRTSTALIPVQTTSAANHSSTGQPAPIQGNSKPPANDNGGGGIAGGQRPANWPTETQAGPAPTATRASAADPFLRELSKAYDNSKNTLFTQVHRGQMTYYGQGLGACGDTYDDNSFTAAVSKLMYDRWPGAFAGEMNRNPICGPYTPGRKVYDAAGKLKTVVAGDDYVIVGGDGLPNCDVGTQCHIPLTATVKHGEKQIQVKIVDRCEACAIGDIDLTPTAFAALADMGLGRTDVEWYFNSY